MEGNGHHYLHIVPILIMCIMLPVVMSFAFTGGESVPDDLRKDMYKNMTMEVMKLVLVVYLVSSKTDMVDLTTKVAGMLAGLSLYYLVLYPLIFGKDVKEDL